MANLGKEKSQLQFKKNKGRDEMLIFSLTNGQFLFFFFWFVFFFDFCLVYTHMHAPTASHSVVTQSLR